MKHIHHHRAPGDAEYRKRISPVICYPNETLPKTHPAIDDARLQKQIVETVIVPPREARIAKAKAGSFFRITCVEGAQVGDLNLWSAENPKERFYSGKTRALHGTHLSTGDRLWSQFPYLRPMATITDDSLDWYGFDEFGGAVHDVIGTRCDPYTHHLLSGADYDHCCHSNLLRAFAVHQSMTLEAAEPYIHDVLNVFMCTGFTRDTGQYFMKASPVRLGDYLEFFAEIDVLIGLSACPGGDCGSEHSSDTAACYPLGIEIYDSPLTGHWQSPPVNQYAGHHGVSSEK